MNLFEIITLSVISVMIYLIIGGFVEQTINKIVGGENYYLYMITVFWPLILIGVILAYFVHLCASIGIKIAKGINKS